MISSCKYWRKLNMVSNKQCFLFWYLQQLHTRSWGGIGYRVPRTQCTIFAFSYMNIIISKTKKPFWDYKVLQMVDCFSFHHFHERIRQSGIEINDTPYKEWTVLTKFYLISLSNNHIPVPTSFSKYNLSSVLLIHLPIYLAKSYEAPFVCHVWL